MGYNIELSFDLTKCGNVTEVKTTIAGFANECGCESYYEDYEMSGNTKNERHHCVMVITFPEDQLFNCSKFVKKIKNIQGVRFECVYDDATPRHRMVYASTNYLKSLHKDTATAFKSNRQARERSFSEGEVILMNEISHKNRRSTTIGCDSDDVPRVDCSGNLTYSR